jgi:RES domain-containing protein
MATARAAEPGTKQAFGRALLEQHVFVVIPSTVSQESWNLLFNPTRAAGRYQLETQKRYTLDTRLNPPRR